VFWFGDQREFRGWYVNLAEPIRRTERGFDTQDHELDVWIRPDGSWEWKDDELLDDWVARGRLSDEEVAEIRAEGARVVADVEAGRQWWSDEWSKGSPDPSWTGVELPPGWDADG
jgi:predicted RNA-binding protein associated with RNAse of E/G family